MKEVKRITRKLGKTKFQMQDIVLCHDERQDRSWGFARVPVSQKVQQTDIELALTDQEFDQFWKARNG